MRFKEYLVLSALAALWGASFLFIKVALADMTLLTLVAVRLLVGALGLLGVVAFLPWIMKGWSQRLWPFFVVAIFNAVIPYLAISWGEEFITSGTAAILNATTPLVVAIVSQWWPGGACLTWARIIGVFTGFAGVALLIGPTMLLANQSALALTGSLLALIGSASYAFGGLFAKRMLAGLPSMQPAIGQTAMGAVILTGIFFVGKGAATGRPQRDAPPLPDGGPPICFGMRASVLRNLPIYGQAIPVFGSCFLFSGKGRKNVARFTIRCQIASACHSTGLKSRGTRGTQVRKTWLSFSSRTYSLTFQRQCQGDRCRQNV